MPFEAERCTFLYFFDAETRAGERETRTAELWDRTARKPARNCGRSVERPITSVTGHATFDPRCETCLKERGTATHPRRATAEAARRSRTVSKVQKSRSWLALVRSERRLRGQCIAKEQHSKLLSSSCRCCKTRYGKFPVHCDQEVCLRTAQPRDWDCLSE